MGFGLYGVLQVDDPANNVGVADELTLVLSDIGFDTDGRLEPADSGGPAGMVFGREGQCVLVNGRRHPTITVRRRAATLAHRQHREEPVLPPRHGWPAVHHHWHRWWIASGTGNERDDC
ncbi:MAG: hypothetical protein R2712_28005 [Vicinamibacterales bacterium]